MADPATKEDIAELGAAWSEFKSTVDAKIAAETKGAVDVVLKDKIERLNGALDKYEDIKQQHTVALQEARQAKEEANELKSQLDALMVKLSRPGAEHAAFNVLASDAQRRAATKARANEWLRANAAVLLGMAVTDEQKALIGEVAAEYKALSIGDDTTGGYLAPVDWVPEIIKGITLISNFRSICRIRTTAMKSQQVPIRKTQFAAVRNAELSQRSETTGLTYGLQELNAPEQTAIVDISMQNLEDSGFDLAAEVQSEGELQFAKGEGAEVVSGTGVEQCEGILVNADIATDTSSAVGGGSATDLTSGDSVLQLSYNLKAGYAKAGTWVMNRKTLGKIRMLKDGVGQYIWQPGLQSGLPNSIDGSPYSDMPDMPDVAAGAFPVAFGDFMRGYSLLDRIAMTMLRDPYTQAGQGLIRFWMRRRVGGRVTLPEAIRKLEIA